MLYNNKGTNENRQKFALDSQNTPRDFSAGDGVARARAVNDASGRGGDLPPSIRGDAPMMLGPHDGGRRRNDNASAPTRVAIHTGPVTPGYKGISPSVAAELYKAPPAFGARIRDHARNK